MRWLKFRSTRWRTIGLRYEEIPLSFDCLGAMLVGVLSLPSTPTRTGVVIVVGGPQYRVGSHRQFVLLARALAQSGIACLRFDYRGMGDSDGYPITYDAAGPDIKAAVRTLRARVATLEFIVLWGLCDGASSCALVAPDVAVAGLVLVNPWTHTEAAGEEALLTHYYRGRIAQGGLWRKLFGGELDVFASLRGLARTIIHVAVGRLGARDPDQQSLPSRVGHGICSHPGPTLIILSGNDMTAAEFRVHAARPGALAKALKRPLVNLVEVPEADHTFSNARSSDMATAVTIDWLHKRFSTTASPVECNCP
jgi:exosortase A-associated hydrolase 1